MVPYLVVVCALVSLPSLLCNPSETKFLRLRNDDMVYTVDGPADNRSSCPDSESRRWSYDFHDCFITRKYSDGGKDLNNIVERILQHAGDCIVNSSLPCRPEYRGFLVIMDKIIEQIKDYGKLYLEGIYHGRDKIKDLDCVETSISNETYANCFRPVFKGEDYIKNVESAMSCINESHTLCSKEAKTILKLILRTIFGVEQSVKEDFEDEIVPTPTPPPMQWYDYIIQPFIAAWNWIKSLFGY